MKVVVNHHPELPYPHIHRDDSEPVGDPANGIETKNVDDSVVLGFCGYGLSVKIWALDQTRIAALSPNAKLMECICLTIASGRQTALKITGSWPRRMTKRKGCSH
jgi:hypothetical protein